MKRSQNRVETVKDMRDLLAYLPDTATFRMQSVEDPDAGLVPIGVVFNETSVEICECLDDED